MKVDILSREYPPKVYGGAGVHAEELSKVLAERVDVTVRAFDGPRTAADIPAIPGTDPKGSLTVVGYDVPKELEDANGALKTFGVDLQIANDVDADIIHAHTWYACLAGYLAKMLHDTPLVITAHSLEPFRPWKREQLGGGYNLSSWAEKDAYEHADRVIAVSAGMREDILTAYPNLDPDKVVVVHNGITMSQFETPADDDPGWKVFERYNIDRSKPTLLFVGRITRQKGLPYLLQALHFVDPNIQVVLCAGNHGRGQDRLRQARRGTRQHHLDRGDAAEAGAQRTRTWLRRIHLPIHLRAARHRESGSHGMRSAGGRLCDRWHSGSRRRRRDRISGAGRPTA